MCVVFLLNRHWVLMMTLMMNECVLSVFQALFPKTHHKTSQLVEQMDHVSSWRLRCNLSKCGRETNRGFIAWTQQNITQLLHLEKSETVLYNNFWDFFWNVDFVLSASLAAQAADQLLLPLNQNRANHLHPSGAHPVSDIKVSQLIKVHTKGYLQG